VSQVTAGGLTRPTIGDILLSHGFVDSGTLAAAAEDQERTGQPLGQILVERGAITRLELASALAEQWAEAPAPGRQSSEPSSGTPASTPAWDLPAKPAVIDDDTYALRVQSAVSDLARRVGAAEPLLAEVERLASQSVSPEALEAGLAEVQEHVDASFERVDGLESRLEGVTTRLDQVTDGLEEAFGEMQAGAAELAERLSMTAAAVTAAATEGDLEAQRQTLDSRLGELAASLGRELQQLDEARATIAVLAERPVLDPAIADRVEELAVRLDDLARMDDLAQLRAAFGGLEERLEAATDSAALAAVRHDVDQLRARQEVPPGLEDRLDDIDALLSEGVTGDIARLDDVEASVTDLTSRIESLGAVAASGSDADAIEELRGALEELGRRRHGDEETVARLEDLAATVSELASRPAADPGLAERIEGLALEGIAAHAVAADFRVVLEELADRGAIGELALAELAGRVEELTAGAAASHVEATVAGVRAEVDEIRRRLESDDAALADLRNAASELSAGPAGDVELAGRLTSLTARVDELAAAAEERVAALHDDSALEQLGLVVASARDELAVRLEEVATRLATLEDGAQAEVDAAGSPADLVALRAELAADLRAGLAGLTAEAPADVGWAREAARLGERIDAISALAGGGLTVGDSDAEEPARQSPVPTELETDTERELERLRMAIERMSMHLGEQERALAEVMRSRGVAQRLDELEARIDDIGAGAGVDGGGATTDAVASAGNSKEARALARRLDAAEATLEAEREKLFAKLERMGSSIDWRLQRLEAVHPTDS
jgi:hypothetical protein